MSSSNGDLLSNQGQQEWYGGGDCDDEDARIKRSIAQRMSNAAPHLLVPTDVDGRQQPQTPRPLLSPIGPLHHHPHRVAGGGVSAHRTLSSPVSIYSPNNRQRESLPPHPTPGPAQQLRSPHHRVHQAPPSPNPASLPFPPPTLSPPLQSQATRRNVSFRTHDEVHRWDEQLETLKLDDDEFLAAANFLLEYDPLIDDGGSSYDSSEDGNGDDDNWKGKIAQRKGGGGDKGGLFKRRCRSILSSPWLCHALAIPDVCSIGDENKDFFNASPKNVIKNGSESRKEERRTSIEQLVRNFEQALKHRAERLPPPPVNTPRPGVANRVVEENEMAIKTREIARRVKAYGLPVKGRGMCVGSGDGDGSNNNGNSGSKSGSRSGGSGEEGSPVKSSPTRGSRQNQQAGTGFPLLPDFVAEEDEDKVGEEAEPVEFDCPPAKTTARNSVVVPSMFSSFLEGLNNFAGRDRYPNEFQCCERLFQIKTETDKVRRMHDATRNDAVRAACRARFEKLKDERRFHQIVLEQHKIRSMMQNTETEVVKRACLERVKHLKRELDALEEAVMAREAKEGKERGREAVKKVKEEEGEEVRRAVEEMKRMEEELREVQEEELENSAGVYTEAGTRGGLANEKNGREWYERALRYVEPSLGPLSLAGLSAVEGGDVPPPSSSQSWEAAT